MEPPPPTPNRLSAILLDDDEAQACLIHRLLEGAPALDIDITHFLSYAEAMADLQLLGTELLFLDQNLGAAETGLEILCSLRESGFEGAVVMLTGSEDQVLISSFFDSGADAYFWKSELNPEVFASTVQNALKLPHKSASGSHADQHGREAE